MDKSDKILAAIDQLAKNLTGQIAAVDAKLSGQIAAVDARLSEQIAEVRSDVARLDTRVANVENAQVEQGQRLKSVEANVAEILKHLDVAELKGRVEEQSRTIASLIPTKVAAVPSR